MQAQVGLPQVFALPTIPTNEVKVGQEVSPLGGSRGAISLLLPSIISFLCITHMHTHTHKLHLDRKCSYSILFETDIN